MILTKQHQATMIFQSMYFPHGHSLDTPTTIVEGSVRSATACAVRKDETKQPCVSRIVHYKNQCQPFFSIVFQGYGLGLSYDL